MAQFAIGSFLFGAVFGLRFKVIVLLPLTLVVGVATIPAALLAHLGLSAALLDLVICALALHGGYIFGSFTRFSLAATRASRMFARPLKAAR